jgi:multiple sugar transport system substrate-binding protein
LDRQRQLTATGRRLFRFVAPLLAALTCTVAACAPAPSPSPPPISIRIVEWQPQRAEVVAGLLPAFEAEMAASGRPVDVELERLDLADSAFRPWITDAYVNGVAPDVTSYPTAWVPDMAARSFLADLTDRVAAWPDWAASFYPVLRERAVQADGHVWSIPRGATVMQLFYRRDVLESLGVSTEQPTSWADLVARMVDLRDRMDRPPILIPAGTTWGGGTFDEGFINLLLGTDSQLYDASTDRWVVRSPGIDAVFGMYETLTREGLLPVAPLLEETPWEPTKYRTFPDGDLAVVTQGTWGWEFDWGPRGRQPIDDLHRRVATWAFPTETGGTPFVWASEAWGWTVSATSDHPDEAWRLVTWLSTGDPLAADLVAVGNLSPRDDVAGIAPYRDVAHLISEERLLAIGRSFQPRVGIEDVQVAVGEATRAIITGAADATEAADLFATLATESLGDERVTGHAAP